MGMCIAEAVGPWQADVALDDQQSVRIAAAATQLMDRRSGVERERDLSAAQARGRAGGHHPGSQVPEDAAEAPEVGGHVLDGVSGRLERALDRTEEAAAKTDAGAREERKGKSQEPGKDLELLEVVALTERVQKGVRDARTQGEPEPVPAAQQPGRLGRRQPLGSAGVTQPLPPFWRSRYWRTLPTIFSEGVSVTSPSSRQVAGSASPDLRARWRLALNLRISSSTLRPMLR